MLNINNYNSVGHSDTLAINELSKAKIAAGEKIYRFGFGQSPFSPPNFLINELAKNAYHHDYLNVQGLELLRTNIANFHSTDNINIKPENIHIAPGSKMIIYNILAAFNDVALILPAPSWVSYMPQSKLLKKDCYYIHTDFQNKWRLSAEKLKSFLTKTLIDKQKQKILILTSPGNPDSLTYSKSQLENIAEICREYNILVIADEIYSLLSFESDYHSIASFYPEKTIVTNGLSKWCGAGGWRLGFCYYHGDFDKNFTNILNGIGSETYSSVAAPVQFAAIKAYNKTNDIIEFIDLQKQILRMALNSITKIFRENSDILFHEAQGGFYLLIDFAQYQEQINKKNIRNIKELCDVLMNDTGVALLPGSAFGLDESCFAARLAFVDFDGTKAINDIKNNNFQSRDIFQNLINGSKLICDWLNSL